MKDGHSRLGDGGNLAVLHRTTRLLSVQDSSGRIRIGRVSPALETDSAIDLLCRCCKPAQAVKHCATALNSKFGSGTGTRTP